MVIALTKQDQLDLLLLYPKLNSGLPRRMVWGTLGFECSYDHEKRELVSDDSSNYPISDSYEIRVDFNQFDTFGFPKVFEESGFIRAYAEEQGLNLGALHINEDDADSCCLGIFPEYSWSGAAVFIRDKVVPFFYWQSYRRLYGKEPWKGFAHGDAGILKAMALSPAEAAKGRLRNTPCTCGSGRKYKKCCLSRDEILKSKLRR